MLTFPSLPSRRRWFLHSVLFTVLVLAVMAVASHCAGPIPMESMD